MNLDRPKSDRLLAEPVPDEPAPRVMAWLDRTIMPSRHLAGPRRIERPLVMPRPARRLDPLPDRAVARIIDLVFAETRRSLEVQIRAVQESVQKLDPEAVRVLAREAASAGDELRGLLQANAWRTALLIEHRSARRRTDLDRRILLPPWLKAANRIVQRLGISATDEPVCVFDLSAPTAWLEQAAVVPPQVLSALSSGPVSADYCEAAWVTRLVPKLVAGQVAPATVWEQLRAPVLEVAATLEKTCQEVLAEHQATIRSIEDGIPTPRQWLDLFDVWSAKLHARFKIWRARRRSGWRLSGIFREIDRLIHLTQQWSVFAAHFELVLAAVEHEHAVLDRATQPAADLTARFGTARAAAAQRLEAIPQGFFETADTLGLLAKSDLAVLVKRRLNPDRIGWLRAARGDLLKPAAPWFAAAERCAATLEDWAVKQAGAIAVDVSSLLRVEFPDLAEPRLVHLKEMTARNILPIRERNAGRRRLLQEWHLPDHDELARLPAVAKASFTDDRLSTAATDHTFIPTEDPDRLELHLHLLGFDPQDYIHWHLFPESAAK